MNAEPSHELLSVISEILTVVPSLRLGQLLGILTDRTDHPYTSNPIVDIEDEELLPAAYEFLLAMRVRQAGTETVRVEAVLAQAG